MGRLLNLIRSENVMAAACFGACVSWAWLNGSLLWPQPDGFEYQPTHFLVGCLAPFLSPLVYFGVRRWNRNWRIKHEIQEYIRFRGQGRRRNAWLIWLPSGLALFTLLFLPLASRVVAPLPGYFPSHRIPVPLPAFVAYTYSMDNSREILLLMSQARLGMTPQLYAGARSSGFSSTIWFSSRRRRSDDPQDSWRSEVPPARIFDIGNGQRLRCAEFQHHARWMTVSCQAPPNARQWNLSASFSGDPKDLDLFYRILAGTTEAR